ncbi:MAG: bifunctional phosphoribosyl-AMP cyclohydrolase/phosphoribosyl-ATP diphosphatase HisIE [Anaerolineae bacterium]
MTEIDWGKAELVPAIVQDAYTGQVLMLAYMNQESLQRTLTSGETWFWSRSRQELWHKGATSGNTQRVREIRYDCDADTLLLLVEPAGPACHTGQQSCFYRRLPNEGRALPPPAWGGILPQLEAVIQDRKRNPREGSYTCQLFDAGLPRMAQKVGEEAVEILIAALAEQDERLVSEVADLTYHAMVLLAARELSWTDVEAELSDRFG